MKNHSDKVPVKLIFQGSLIKMLQRKGANKIVPAEKEIYLKELMPEIMETEMPHNLMSLSQRPKSIDGLCFSLKVG